MEQEDGRAYESRVRCCGEEKNLFPLMELIPLFLGSPVHSLVTILTELIRLPMTNDGRQAFICLFVNINCRYHSRF
jgi:hypothetical protein